MESILFSKSLIFLGYSLIKSNCWGGYRLTFLSSAHIGGNNELIHDCKGEQQHSNHIEGKLEAANFEEYWTQDWSYKHAQTSERL